MIVTLIYADGVYLSQYILYASHVELDRLFISQLYIYHICLIAEPMAPVFIKPLKDLKIVVGQPIFLEAQISAFPSPEVKWFKDGTQLRPSQAFNFVNQPNGIIGLK